jgi:hypothetical protein
VILSEGGKEDKLWMNHPFIIKVTGSPEYELNFSRSIGMYSFTLCIFKNSIAAIV